MLIRLLFAICKKFKFLKLKLFLDICYACRDSVFKIYSYNKINKMTDCEACTDVTHCTKCQTKALAVD